MIEPNLSWETPEIDDAIRCRYVMHLWDRLAKEQAEWDALCAAEGEPHEVALMCEAFDEVDVEWTCANEWTMTLPPHGRVDQRWLEVVGDSDTLWWRPHVEVSDGGEPRLVIVACVIDWMCPTELGLEDS